MPVLKLTTPLTNTLPNYLENLNVKNNALNYLYNC